jgi:hypothetical protein
VAITSMNLSDIFLGVTPKEVRDYVGVAIHDLDADHVVHPCAGRFGAVAAVLAAGGEPTLQDTSDLNLFSSVIGYCADPNRHIADLDLKPNEEVAPFLNGVDPADELDVAARILLGIKYVQLPPVNRYQAGVRREVLNRRDVYAAGIRARLEKLVEALEGIRYRAINMWDVVEEVEAHPPEDHVVFYVSASWYAEGYVKQFAMAEEAFGWPGLVGREFIPDTLPELLNRLDVLEHVTTMVHVNDQISHLVPEDSFKAVMAYEPVRDRIDRVFCNRDLDRLHAPRRIRQSKHRILRLWDDADITPESELAIVPVDADTALYIRDLFVHRIGGSSAQEYWVMTIDGKVAAVCGTMGGFNRPGEDGWVRENFGIVATSKRYNRLGRLYAMAITTTEFRDLLVYKVPQLRSVELLGIQSTDFRKYPESKIKRGLFKTYNKEKQPDGTWKIQAVGKFREGDTFAKCLARWCEKWGVGTEKQTEEAAA